MADKYATYGASLLRDFSQKNLESLFKTQKFMKKLLAMETPSGGPFLFQVVDNHERMRALCRFLADHITRQKIMSDCVGPDSLGYFSPEDGASTLMCFMRDSEGCTCIRNLLQRNPTLIDCFTPAAMNTLCTRYGTGKIPGPGKSTVTHLTTDFGPTTLAFCAFNSSQGLEFLDMYLCSASGRTLTGRAIGELTCGKTRSMLFHFAWNKNYKSLQLLFERQPDILKEVETWMWVESIVDPMEMLVRPVRKGWSTLFVFCRQKQTEPLELLKKYGAHLFEAAESPSKLTLNEEVLLRQVEDIEAPRNDEEKETKANRNYMTTCLLVEMQRTDVGRELATTLFKNNPLLLREMALTLRSRDVDKVHVVPHFTGRKGDPEERALVSSVVRRQLEEVGMAQPFFDSLFEMYDTLSDEEVAAWRAEKNPPAAAPAPDSPVETPAILDAGAEPAADSAAKKKKKKKRKKKKKANGDANGAEAEDADDGEEDDADADGDEAEQA